MSCKHGNHVDDCELCDVENELWRKYAVMRDERDALSAQLSEARQQSEAEAIAYSSLSAEHERLKAQLSEAQARLADAESRIEQAQKQEPAAWAYRFDLQKRHDDVHDNDAYFEVVYRTHRELSPDDPFGKRGKDFDDAAETTETPLYAAPVAPAAQAVADDVVRDAERYRWMRDVTGEVSADALIDALEQYGEEFDKAIDAAMLAASKQKVGGE